MLCYIQAYDKDVLYCFLPLFFVLLLSCFVCIVTVSGHHYGIGHTLVSVLIGEYSGNICE
jgi:hypothetical protein